jgi:hypothetical protein
MAVLFLFSSSGCEKGMADDGGYEIFKFGNVVAMTTNNGCILFDVTTPESASVVSRIDIGYSNGVSIVGNTLFISSDGEMYSYDIKNPSSPVKSGSIVTSIASIFVRDTLAFLKTADGVEIISIKDPSHMLKLAEYKFSTIGYGCGIYATGDRIYATNGDLKQLSYNSYGDISLLKTIPGPAHSISSDGNFLYIATYSTGAKIVSIQNKNNVYNTGSIDFGKTWGVTHSEGFMYVASSYTCISKVDVANKNSPLLISQTGDKFACHGIYYDDGYLYVAGTERGFFILNAEDLSVVFD